MRGWDLHPLARLAAFLEDDEKQAAETLAASRAQPIEEIPSLVRILEEVAALRRFHELRERGETRTESLNRTAREIGVPRSTLRHRLAVTLRD